MRPNAELNNFQTLVAQDFLQLRELYFTALVLQYI